MRVIIIGAGAAGLSAAKMLTKHPGLICIHSGGAGGRGWPGKGLCQRGRAGIG